MERIVEEIDDILDELCFLIETDEIVCQLLNCVEIHKLIAHLNYLPSLLGSSSVNSDLDHGGSILFHVVSAWCWCDRRLQIFLLTEQIRIDASPEETWESDLPLAG